MLARRPRIRTRSMTKHPLALDLLLDLFADAPHALI
jgi:hypothetical protein